MTTNEAPGALLTERIKQSLLEISPILEILRARKDPITAHLQGGELLFESRLRVVDPIGSCIILEPSKDEPVNDALLARPRCSFFASPPGRHVEFAAGNPQKITHSGTAAIRLNFPDVLVERQRRGQERIEIAPQIPLDCLADDGGVLSFNGGLVDVSAGGVGFLIYHPSITLEPGTVLKGCRIESREGSPPLILDLEVRFSELISLPDGTRAERSGCKVVAHPETLKEFVQQLSA